VCAKGHGDAAICTPDSAGHKGSHQEIAAAAAVLFRDGYTGISLFREAFPDPGGKIVGEFDFVIVWFYLVSREGKGAFIGDLMLQRQFEVHAVAILSGVQEQKILGVVYVLMGDDYKRLGQYHLIFRSDKQHLMCYTRKHLLKIR